MRKTLLAIAVVDGFASAVILAGALLAQITTAVPPVKSGWETIGFLAVLAFNAYMFYQQKEASLKTQTKVDNVHSMLNSELAKFKLEAAEQYRTALTQGVALAKADSQREVTEKLTAMEAKIAALEGKLDSAREKAVVLAAAHPSSDSKDVNIVNPGPVPVSITPEKRLEEIRGET